MLSLKNFISQHCMIMCLLSEAADLRVKLEACTLKIFIPRKYSYLKMQVSFANDNMKGKEIEGPELLEFLCKH